MPFAMELPLVYQVRQILRIQPGCDDAVEGGRRVQATAAQLHCCRLRDGWQGDGAACTTVLVDRHLTFALKTQRYLAVAAHATQGAVVGKEPVEQTGADVVNQWFAAGLTVWVSWVSCRLLLPTVYSPDLICIHPSQRRRNPTSHLVIFATIGPGRKWKPSSRCRSTTCCFGAHCASPVF